MFKKYKKWFFLVEKISIHLIISSILKFVRHVVLIFFSFLFDTELVPKRSPEFHNYAFRFSVKKDENQTLSTLIAYFFFSRG